ncbi:MAG: GNAT family N-acetyltransferase [Acidobacteria bacterium]|nr:GNAT family N-acetyltransferase [Acidobacteriota bacterium]MBK8812015.1 GNAT family N-acetyltransferase [Acidobacteriota bacterium]
MKLQLAYSAKNQRVNSLEYVFANAVANLNRVSLLTESDRTEVLEFLKKRPVHTVVMTSFIYDNGLESPNNRGKFFSFRNAAGTLEGVALIGHTTLVECHSEDALIALALKARESETPIKLMMSDGNSIEHFWQYYSGEQREPRLVCEEQLFEIKFPVIVREPVENLRLATEADLLPVAEAHAEIAFLESGVNPLEKDREGFLKRVLRRINQNRVWVVFDNEKLVFQTQIVAETDDVSYLEGVYVNPEYRGKGIGSNCLSQLSRTLLENVKYVCMLSNTEFKDAHRAYSKAGFKSKDCCVTMFV